MNEERPEGLTREERSAYTSLGGPQAPPSELEDRVMSALSARGLIRSEPGVLARLLERFRAVPLAPRMAVVGAALIGMFVLGVEVGKRSDGSEVPEAVLEPDPTNLQEEYADDSGLMVAEVTDPAAETSYVQVTVATKPMLTDEEGSGDYRPYPLDGEVRPYSMSR